MRARSESRAVDGRIAAVAAGPDAVLSHDTAAELLGPLRCRDGFRARRRAGTGSVHVGVPHARPVRSRQRVERAHGLPEATRQTRWVLGGESRYGAVRDEPWWLVVELDGRVAHTGSARWRDLARDDATVVDGRSVLRYGWSGVCDRPCEVATQVVTMPRRGGWQGMVRRCSPRCGVSTQWKIP